MDNATLLEVSNISKSFGGIKALQDVSLTFEEGGILGLIGPNGSGKTTLLNCISGFYSPDGGQIIFNGNAIHGMPPERIARTGLCRTFQLTLNPEHMTVMENMLLGPQNQLGEQLFRNIVSMGAVRKQEHDNLERAYELLKLVKLGRHVDEYAGNLSGGQKKLLALGQILMAKPRLILLDEPVAGVNPKLIEEIIDVIRGLQESGQNFLIIEHNMRAIRRLCDQVCVLNAGQVLAKGEVEATLSQEDVLRAYLGSSH